MKKACSVCLINCFRLHGAQEEGEDVDTCLRCVLLKPGAADKLANVRHPSFLQKITESTMSTLKLPLSFVTNHTERLGEAVILEGPSMKHWRVELQRTFRSFNISFGQGWAKFVADHGLQIGDQLSFSLSKKSYLHVEVYDQCGLQKTSALDATNKAKVEKNIKDVHEPKDLHGVDVAPAARQEDDDEPEKATESPEQLAVDITQSTGSKSRIVSALENDMVIDGPAGSEDSGCLVMETVETDRIEQLLPSQMIVETDRIEQLLAPQTIVETDRIEQLLPPQTIIGREVVSRRRCVTEMEKVQALQRAKALKLVHPNTLMVMTRSHVYKCFMLVLPRPFARDFSPSENKEITLLDESGQQWPAKFLASSGCLSAGWRRFSLDHRLEEHDVCVLELVDKADYTLMVHIFRVLNGPEEDPGLDTSGSTPSRSCKGKKNTRKSSLAISNSPEAHFIPKESQKSTAKANELTWEPSPGTKGSKRKPSDETSGSLAKAKRLSEDHHKALDKSAPVDERVGNGPENELNSPGARASSPDEVPRQISNSADVLLSTGILQTTPIVEAREGRKKGETLYRIVYIYKGRSVGDNTDYLAEIEGYTEGSSTLILDRDDDTGFWWIPSELFEWDMLSCRIE